MALFAFKGEESWHYQRYTKLFSHTWPPEDLWTQVCSTALFSGWVNTVHKLSQPGYSHQAPGESGWVSSDGHLAISATLGPKRSDCARQKTTLKWILKKSWLLLDNLQWNDVSSSTLSHQGSANNTKVNQDGNLRSRLQHLKVGFLVKSTPLCTQKSFSLCLLCARQVPGTGVQRQHRQGGRCWGPQVSKCQARHSAESECAPIPLPLKWEHGSYRPELSWGAHEIMQTKCELNPIMSRFPTTKTYNLREKETC